MSVHFEWMGILYLEDLPGSPGGISTLVVVLVDNLPHEIVAGAREHPGLKPVGHIIDVVKIEVILSVQRPPCLVCPDLPVAAQGPGVGGGDGPGGLQLYRGAARLRGRVCGAVSGAGAGGGLISGAGA